MKNPYNNVFVAAVEEVHAEVPGLRSNVLPRFFLPADPESPCNCRLVCHNNQPDLILVLVLRVTGQWHGLYTFVTN